MKVLIKNVNIITGEGGIITNGYIGINGDKINYISNEAPKDDSFKDAHVIDGKDGIAMPGLVNAHTHCAMTLLRNYADDMPLEKWLFENIIPREGQLTEEDIYRGTVLGIAEMIKSGTTTFADMYLHMDQVASAVTETGIRANLSRGPITSGVRGNGLSVDTNAFMDYKNRWDNTADGRIKVSMEIHSVYLFDEPSIREAAQLAKSTNSGIHIHLSETRNELATSIEKYGVRPIEACESFGVFDVPVIGAHCVHLDDKELDILKKYNVNPVHNPSSNLKLGSGIARIPDMLSRGINVCLGTDGAASNNNLDMLEEMHIAALLHKGVNYDPLCMKAEEVIKMTTVNGAKALGFNDVGLLKEGMKADIIIIDTDNVHMRPLHNPQSSITYSAQGSDVDTVIVNGKVLMKDKELLTIDEEKLLKSLR
jgi:5-methylthioadenosine/S-adenosylhomocysteine deaminase